LLDDIPKAEEDSVEDPFTEHKRKTVADREDEYRARWRKRKLSPPKYDPFNQKDKVTEEKRTYKDVMMEVLLEKEHQTVLRKIHDKERDKHKAVEEQRREVHDKRKQDEEEERKGWTLIAKKNGKPLGAPMTLIRKNEYTFGRAQEEVDVWLEHPSCSKHHARVFFLRIENRKGHRKWRPHVADNHSTNGTFVSKKKIEAARPYEVTDEDILQFGCSKREYRILKNK